MNSTVVVLPSGEEFRVYRPAPQYGDIQVCDADGFDFAILPHWISDDKIESVIALLSSESKKAFESGEKSGREKELRRIAPLVQALADEFKELIVARG